MLVARINNLTQNVEVYPTAEIEPLRIATRHARAVLIVVVVVRLCGSPLVVTHGKTRSLPKPVIFLGIVSSPKPNGIISRLW